MIHSQSDEEGIILEFFKDKKDGVVLDIGAYHYATFSNSRALINTGWSAVLVEPSPRCFSTIMRFYKDDPKITLVNAFIGQEFKLIQFHDSEGAVATGCADNYERWSKVQNDFQTIWIPQIPSSELLKVITKTDFITIDCEGADYFVLRSLPLDVLKPSLLCVEYSSHGNEIHNYMINRDFILHHQNGENLIFKKEYK